MISWYLSFYAWLISLSMIISRSMHVASNDIISFLFCDWVISSLYIHTHTHMHTYICVHVCACHIFFIHSSINGHSGCFYVLATLSNAAVNIGMQVSYWIMVFSEYMARSGIGGSYDSSVFIFFKGLACCFDPDWSLLWKLVWGRASAHWSGSQSIRCPVHAYSPLKRELISISLYFSDKFPNVYDVLVWAVTQTLCNSTWKASSNLWNHPSLSYSSKSESSFILHRKSYLHSPGNSDHSFFSPLILHLDLHILALKFSLVCS